MLLFVDNESRIFMWTKRKHHMVFSRFHRWSGHVPAGFDVDFLGSRHKTAYFSMCPPEPMDRYEAPQHPNFDEEYFEWIDLLEAILSCKDRFAMLDLGAGWGRWSARAAAACQQLGLPYRLVAVEAEPTRFQWILENFKDNGIRLGDCRLMEAAVSAYDGTVGFQAGNPAESYGESIGGSTQVRSVSLPTLLRTLELVDLIDLDIQGAELEVLEVATASLAQKVKRVHVETHNDRVHVGIHRLFRTLGWRPHFLFQGASADKTPWGQIDFQGGTQSWLNPRLCGREELRRARTVRNSVSWRASKIGRAAVDRFAPPGTLRRRLFNATLSGVGRKYRRDPQDIVRRPMGW
jgi:FkbM family methyltransferase